MADDPRLLVLAELRKQTALLERIAAALAPKTDIPDALLNGPYGDPIVKAEPRDWAGDSMKGRHFSECSPEWLDLAAEMYDYFASKPDQDEKKRGYNVTDAKRARGWAARKRAGWIPPQTSRVDETQGEPTW